MTVYERDTIPESAAALSPSCCMAGLADASGLIEAVGQLAAGAGR
jgi:hypothetical protein